jgi:hypothetical protein
MINQNEYHIISCPYNICIRNLIKSSFKTNKNNKTIFFSSHKENFYNKFIKDKYNIKNSYNYCKTQKIFRLFYFILSSIETNLVVKNKVWTTMSLIKKRLYRNEKIEENINHDFRLLNSSICNFITSYYIIYVFIKSILLIILFILSFKYLIIFLLYRPKKILFLHAHANQDKGLLIIAKLLKIKTYALINSWDNPTTKLILPIKFDIFFSWNKFNKKEICYLNNVKTSKVVITGIPQFDNYNYFIKNKKKINNIYKKKFNIYNKKVICIFLPSAGLINLNTQKIIITKIYENLEKINNCFLHVRLHPGTKIKDLNYLNFNKKKIYFDYPDQLTIADSYNTAIKYNKSKSDSLEKILILSDVTINFVSTTTIDAVYFNKPIINININSDKKNSINWIYQWSHYKQLMKFNAVSLCKDFNALILTINKYLKNKNYKKKKRELLKKNYCHYNDSLSGYRISNIFFNSLV